jgi:hypothetical protein
MDSAKKQLTDKLTSAANILVTVSRNPSVDQLAACIGLTLILNKLDKHATAVFSGAIPSTIEFLQPEGTLEKNTDSLRDFIIALDKSKADKLRYKVEDQLVRIFITPYRTSITQNDLEFSQGDFNVDLVIALGVGEQADLDDAITAHGRILHDATVASINATSSGALGSINWDDPTASSLCELIGELAPTLGEKLLDAQISTALLTGIVAETLRFSNEKTTPKTMSTSSALLASGADQQLVATKLQPPAPVVKPIAPPVEALVDAPEEKVEKVEEVPAPPKSADGTLEIAHDDHEFTPAAQPVAMPALQEEVEHAPLPQPVPKPFLPPVMPPVTSEPEPQSDHLLSPIVPPTEDDAFDMTSDTNLSPGAKLIVEPPSLGGILTANSRPEPLEPSIDPLGLSMEPAAPLLSRNPSEPVSVPEPQAPLAVAASLPHVHEPLLTGFTPPPPAWVPASDDAADIILAPQKSETIQPRMPFPTPLPASPLIDNSNLETNTLQSIEESVHSPHLETPDVSDARDEVLKALQDSSSTLEPTQSLNALPLGGELHAPDSPTLVQPVPPVVAPMPYSRSSAVSLGTPTTTVCSANHGSINDIGIRRFYYGLSTTYTVSFW